MNRQKLTIFELKNFKFLWSKTEQFIAKLNIVIIMYDKHLTNKMTDLILYNML